MRLFRSFLSAAMVVALVGTATPVYAVSDNHTESVSFADTMNGFIAGGYGNATGFMSSTNDGGATWHGVVIPSKWMAAVSAATTSSAWAVADYDDHAYSTGTDGASWALTGPVFGTGGVNLVDADRFASGRVLAAATLNQTTDGDVLGMSTSDNSGASWTKRFAGPIQPAPDPNDPNALAQFTHASAAALSIAPGSSTAWVIGNEWTPSNGNDGSTAVLKQVLIYKTADGGSTWSAQAAPITGGNVANDIVAVSPTVAFAGGTGRKFFKTTDGATWTVATLPAVASHNIEVFGIGAADANTVVLVGTNNSSGTGEGLIRWSTDGGATWPGIFYGGSTLRSVSVIDAMHWVAVGDNETIYRTSDGGATWAGTTGRIAPTVSISAPATNAQVSGSTASVTGVSADIGVGVVAVDVAVVRQSDSMYWNGSAWQVGEFWNPASTLNGWDQWDWSWSLEPGQSGTPAYTIKARATDGVGNVSLVNQVTGVTVSSTTGGSLQGTVTGTGGAPLVGASVKVSGVATATTIAGGNYTITGIAPGTPAVAYSATGYDTRAFSDVTITSGGTATKNVQLTATITTGTISGTVRGPGGIGLLGVSVKASTLPTVTTIGDGTYSITDVPAGSPNVTYSLADYVLQTWTVPVTAGATSPQDVTLVAIATSGDLTGTVRGVNNAPLVGATVTVDGAPPVITGSGGTYTVPGLLAGPHLVSCSASGYTTQSGVSVNIVAGVATGQNFLLTLVPQVTGTITGRVLSGGVGLAGVSVSVLPYASVTTGSDGSYSVPSVVAGPYDVVYSRSGYTAQSKSVTVHANPNVQPDVTLVPLPAPPVTRAGGANRYDVAVGLAASYKPGLAYTDVIVACGEDRAMADPLAASGLAGVWDAPILLTPSKKLNASTAGMITAIRNANGGRVNIHVIGGTTSMPKAMYTALGKLKGSGTIERIDGKDRYAVAAKMASRVAASGKSVPGVLVANIENPAAFYDALAASPLSARAHLPIVGVRKTSIPAAASAVLNGALAGKPRYAVNSAYLTSGVMAGATPMASSGDRITAATQIAGFGADPARGWVSYRTVGLANKLPDALTGGALVGMKDGVMLYTNVSPLAPVTAGFLPGIKSGISEGIVLGGPVSVSDATVTQFYNTIKP